MDGFKGRKDRDGMNAPAHGQDFTRMEAEEATPVDGGAMGRRPVALTIAGFDPSSGAGITADLKVFISHGIYGMACITGLTVQSTQGVRGVEPVTASTVAATLQMLAEDVEFSGIKVGMLATAEVANAVTDFLDSVPGVPVVLDPVLRSSSGRELLELEGVVVLRERLLGRIDWITPNREELEILIRRTISRPEEVPAGSERLRELARQKGNERLKVVVTGGDQDPPKDYLSSGGEDSGWISGQRVVTNSTHGTGCAFSSALLCRLVGGDAPRVAAVEAKEYVAAALKAAYPVGRGKGPMNHLFKLA
jgi:hydroxymethylpyrimidine/phosphomethylpyrimidine kinase